MFFKSEASLKEPYTEEIKLKEVICLPNGLILIKTFYSWVYLTKIVLMDPITLKPIAEQTLAGNYSYVGPSNNHFLLLGRWDEMTLLAFDSKTLLISKKIIKLTQSCYYLQAIDNQQL